MLVFLQRLSLLLTREHLLRAIGDIDHIRQFVTQKTKRFLKRAAYGTGIGVTSLVAIGALMVAFGVTPFPEPAQADAAASIAGFFAQVVLIPVYFVFGIVSVTFAAILDMVIGYPWSPSWVDPLTTSSTAGGGFVNVSAVVTGWRIVRDICNLFFAIILLIIALAAVLNLESYKWQDLLRKFVLYAVLINFSKTICGFFTDAATVAMATFGGSFGYSWGTGLIAGFGLPSLGGLADISTAQGQVSSQASSEDGIINMLGAIILMVILQFLSLVIIASFVVMITLRVVMIWFLIVLSPIAYVTRILDITKRYSSQWWEMWGRYVVMGPFIVFFLWLTLTMLNGSATGADANGIGGAAATPLVQGLTEVDALSKIQGSTASGSNNTGTLASLSSISAFQVTQPNILANFAIALVMMSGALRFASGMSGEIGSSVSTVSDKVGSVAPRLIGVANRWTSNRAGEVQNGKIPLLGFAAPALKAAADPNSRFGAAYRNFGVGLDLIANNVLDPQGAFARISNNLDRKTKEDEAASDAGYQGLTDSLASPDQGIIKRTVGILAGASSVEGTIHFRESLNLSSLFKSAWSQSSGLFTGESGIRKEWAQDKELADVKAQAAMSDEDLAKVDAEKLQALQVAASDPSRPDNDNIELDMDDVVVRGAIEAKIAALRGEGSAESVAAADALQNSLTNRGKMSLGAAKQLLRTSGLSASAVNTLPADLAASAKGLNRKKLAKARQDALLSEITTTRGANNLDGRALQDRQVEEVSKRYASLQPIELKPEFIKAMRNGKQPDSLAIMRKLAETGNFSWAFRNWTQEMLDADPQGSMAKNIKSLIDLDPMLPKKDRFDSNGNLIEKSLLDENGNVVLNDSPSGQELFRRFFGSQLGMTDNDSLRFMGSRVSPPEADRAKASFAGTYQLNAKGNYEYTNDPASRLGVASMMTADKSAVESRQRDANGYVIRNGRGGDVIGVHQIGLARIKAFEDTFINEFDAWNIDARDNLSQPAALRDLMKGGVSDVLIRQLIEFRHKRDGKSVEEVIAKINAQFPADDASIKEKLEAIEKTPIPAVRRKGKSGQIQIIEEEDEEGKVQGGGGSLDIEPPTPGPKPKARGGGGVESSRPPAGEAKSSDGKSSDSGGASAGGDSGGGGDGKDDTTLDASEAAGAVMKEVAIEAGATPLAAQAAADRAAAAADSGSEDHLAFVAGVEAEKFQGGDDNGSGGDGDGE